MSGNVHFFISYSGHDVSWARWIDSVLREHGYETVSQFRSFEVGKSFVEEMARALEAAERTLCLFSDAYFGSKYCKREWQAAFVSERLFPVRIAACSLPELLGPIAHVDLVGLPETTAAERLLTAASGSLQRSVERPSVPSGPSARYPGVRSGRAERSLPPVWSVPRRRNIHFTGRKRLLAKLHERLMSDNPAPMLVSGLGGIGKTQVALEYAYRYAADYDGVWWLRAEDPTTLMADYAGMAEALGISDESDQSAVVPKVRRALSERDRFLLIFDNVSDVDVEPYLPQGSGCRVLITTRARQLGNAEVVRLQSLSSENAIEFLIRRTRAGDFHDEVPQPAGEEHAPASADVSAAAQIAEMLGQLPLALEQAAAYIETRGKTLAEYRRLLGEHGLAVLERGEAHDYERTVRTTWGLALEALAETPGAPEVLDLCAFFAPEAIDLSALQRGSKQVEREAGPSALGPVLAQTLGDSLALDDVKEELLRYSLVTAEGDAISVHRLVQEVTQDRMSPEARRTGLIAAVQLVKAVFPEDGKPASAWSECQRWLPHARAIASAASSDALAPHALAELCNQMALYLKTRAAYSEAEPLYRQAIALGKRILGANHASLGTYYNNLAELLRSTDRMQEAEHLFLRALAIHGRALGARHPDVARDLNNLALVHKSTGRLSKAEPLYRRALDIYLRIRGPEDNSVATGMSNLGSLLRMLQRTDEAEPLLRRALSIHEANLGPEDPNVAIDLNNLARLLEDLGRVAEAEPLYVRALAIYEAKLPPLHPITEQIRRNAARASEALLRSGAEGSTTTAPSLES